MSLIYEALKKSEQKRQQNQSPSKNIREKHLAIFASNMNQSKMSLPLLLGGAMLLLATGAWWWLSPADLHDEMNQGRDSIKEMSNQPVALQPSPASPVQDERVTAQISHTAPPVPRSVTRAKLSEESTLPVEQAIASKENVRQESSALDSTKMPEIIKGDDDKTDGQAVTGSSRHPMYEELPQEWRDRLPEIKITMHYYTEAPTRRLVRINDGLLHEGDWVDQETRLVKITRRGVTLTYQGTSFELPIDRR